MSCYDNFKKVVAQNSTIRQGFMKNIKESICGLQLNFESDLYIKKEKIPFHLVQRDVLQPLNKRQF